MKKHNTNTDTWVMLPMLTTFATIFFAAILLLGRASEETAAKDKKIEDLEMEVHALQEQTLRFDRFYYETTGESLFDTLSIEEMITRCNKETKIQ